MDPLPSSLALTFLFLAALTDRVAATREPRAPPERTARPVAASLLSGLVLAGALGLLVLCAATPWLPRAARSATLAGGILLAALGAGGHFLLYRFLLECFRSRRPAPGAREDLPAAPPTVTLLIAAHNEEEVIRHKIENSLELRYPGALEIVVASDGSHDRTDAIVAGYRGRGVRLFRNEPRTGKAGLLRRALETVGTDVVVLSDANAFYDRDAITRLVAPLGDPSVGAVTGSVKLIAPGADPARAPDSWLARLEKEALELESLQGSCVGVDGAMVTVRRDLVPAYRDGTILDDFVLAMAVVNRGYRVVLAPAAKGWEVDCPTLRGEYERRARLLAGIVQLYREGMGLPLWRSGVLGRFLGHKVWRWCAPAYAVVLVVQVLVFDPLLGAAFLLAGGLAACGGTALAVGFGGASARIGCLLACQAGAFAGLYRGLRLKQSGAWRRTERAGAAPGSSRAPPPASCRAREGSGRG